MTFRQFAFAPYSIVCFSLPASSIINVPELSRLHPTSSLSQHLVLRRRRSE